jgi:hypothetical protein
MTIFRSSKREDEAFEHGYKLGRQGAGTDYARRAERMRRAGRLAEMEADEQRGRDMARAAFARSTAPGSAALLAEVERGWARRDRREQGKGSS